MHRTRATEDAPRRCGAAGKWRGPESNRRHPGFRHFAAVAASGDFVRSDATHGGHTAAGSGIYTVGFDDSVPACASSATLGSTDAAVVPAGRVTVRDAGGQVEVRTFDSSGAPADLPFDLIVAC